MAPNLKPGYRNELNPEGKLIGWPKFDRVDGITNGLYLRVLRGSCEPWVEGDDDGVAPEQVAETFVTPKGDTVTVVRDVASKEVY
jgi:hypothetical protein